MNIIEARPRYQRVIMAATLCVLAASCGQDQIFGNVATAALVPAVITETPTKGAVGVLVTTASISATLNEAVSPITDAVSFTLTCAPSATCVNANATGTVSLDATHTIVTLTLTPGTILASSQLYTATLGGVTSLASGVAMAGPFQWTFTTVAKPADLTRPRVVLTSPSTTSGGPTPGVPSNSSISAVFSKAMAPATISNGNFTVTCSGSCISPGGNVSYSVTSQTAVFTPASDFTVGDTYTVRLSMLMTEIGRAHV